MQYPQIPADELLRRLTLPDGVLRMVLDTDTYNEVDDQFALAYALASPERLRVEAVYAAPFWNDNSTGPADGMERSYQEIRKILGKMGVNPDGFALRGSAGYLPAKETPVESDAARDLIRRAMAMPEGELLYVVAIGAITNVASAILLEPAIIGKICVVWLGGNASWWPTQREFNLMQDVPAAQVIYDCGVPFVLLPCMGVVSALTTTLAELEYCIGGKNALCDYLIEIVRGYSGDHFAWGKEIWDVATIAYLMRPDMTLSSVGHAPMLTDEMTLSDDPHRHFMRSVYHLNRNAIFYDLYKKLGGL